MTYAPPSSTAHFTDVSSSNFAFNYIQKMNELGVTAGCTSTTYCPDAAVTNGAMAIFAVRARQLIDGFCSTNCVNNSFTNYSSMAAFSDVSSSDAEFKWVQKVSTASNGLSIVSNLIANPGCSTVGAFCKDANAQRAQVAFYVIRGLIGDMNN